MSILHTGLPKQNKHGFYQSYIKHEQFEDGKFLIEFQKRYIYLHKQRKSILIYVI